MHVPGSLRAQTSFRQASRYSRLPAFLGLFCLLIGYWAPWVAHPAAGLVQNGFDLGEFVPFLPQVRNGSEPLNRWLFFLPLATISLGIALSALRPAAKMASGLRAVLGAAALVLLIVLIPPYPYTPERLLGDEFRGRAILALLSWIAFAAIVAWRRRWPSTKGVSILLASLAVVGAAGPIGQFLSLRDALSAVYGEPIAVGWGVGLTTVGALAVLLDAVVSAVGAGEQKTC